MSNPAQPPCHPQRLRRLRRSDAAAIAALERRAFDQPWSEGSIRDLLAQPVTVAWSLESPSSSLIAYACFHRVVDEAELLRIAVAPGARRRGVGGRLLDHATRVLRRAGIRRLHLEVRADNAAAIALYRRAGFIVTSRRRRYYDDGCDAWLMTAEHGCEQPRS